MKYGKIYNINNTFKTVNNIFYVKYKVSIHVYDLHLAQLGLRVHKDLTHFTLEVLAGHSDAAFAAKPLALASCTSCHHLPPASRQDAVTFQHQFVLCTWREDQDN